MLGAMKTTLLTYIGALLLASLVAAFALTAQAASESPSELLEKGIYTEETKGDIDSAIAIYQELVGALPGGVWSSPAYFNNTVYYGSVSSPLKAFSISNAKLSTPPSSQTANSFPYPGTTPVISANGNSNGIVWAVENSNPAVLHAYDATNLANELYNSNQASGGRDQFGPGNKFITPLVVNGKVFVGTQTGVAEFGLLQ